MEGYLYPLVTDRVTWGFGVFELKYNKLNCGGVGLPFEWLKEKRELRWLRWGLRLCLESAVSGLFRIFG